MKTILDILQFKKIFFDRTLLISFTLLYVFILIIVTISPVEAKVMVAPTRLTFEEGQRSATVRLINTEDKQVTYRIALFHSRMTGEGSIETIVTPAEREQRLAEKLAQDLLRYSPRQVTLPAKTTQLVRLQLRIPADLEEGEYRSRLLFQEIPEHLESDGDVSEGESKISLRVIFGVSIPVIIRHGQTWAEVELSDLQYKPGQGNDSPELSLKINRSGNRSVFGDIEVTFIPEKGEEKVVGRVKGIAVYPEIGQRKYNLSLNRAEGIALEKGKLYVSYRRAAEEGYQLLADKELEL